MTYERFVGASVIIGNKWLYALKGNIDNIERIEISNCAKWECVYMPDLYPTNCSL